MSFMIKTITAEKQVIAWGKLRLDVFIGMSAQRGKVVI